MGTSKGGYRKVPKLSQTGESTGQRKKRHQRDRPSIND